MPRRYQLKRARGGGLKGGAIPEGSVYVGRPTKWGNPFKITETVTREESIASFEKYLREMPTEKRTALLAPLRGKNLVCWCPLNVPCHADVLLKWANLRLRGGKLFSPVFGCEFTRVHIALEEHRHT
jgi:hypothetical protein